MYDAYSWKACLVTKLSCVHHAIFFRKDNMVENNVERVSDFLITFENLHYNMTEDGFIRFGKVASVTKIGIQISKWR